MQPLDVQKIRAEFPNLSVRVHDKPLVYFDNAATTLKPQSVIDAVEAHYKSYTSNVHRGIHYLSEKATAEYENGRDKVREFIGAQKTSQIIFTKGTTESINLVAQSYGHEFLKAGDEILITEMEHHSNIVPWQILCQKNGCVLKVVPINDQGEIDVQAFKDLLTPKTKLVSVVYISNSLGTINPVKEITDASHQAGALVFVDGAQAVAHDAVHVQELDCDFFAFSGHKLFGPTGVGVLYGKEEILDAMPPYQAGGDMIASVTFEKTSFNILPYKFEAGTPNVAGVIGLGAAIDFVNNLDRPATLQHKQELLEYATRQLLSLNGLRLIGTAQNKMSILSFVFSDIHPHDLGTLVDEEGVAIRTGHHCTQPVMQRFQVPATARASLTFYNTKDEIDTLVTALQKAKDVFS